MIVYYAIGGGLGHVTRARRVLAALGIEAKIVGSSDIPPHLEQSLAAHRAWIEDLGAERIIADTFPLGIRGELAEIAVPLDYVGRLLRWEEYRRVVPGPLPRFGTSYFAEELTPEHEAAIRAASDFVWSAAAMPPLLLNDEIESGGHGAALQKYWIVVHSGPESEVRELLAYATSQREIRNETARIVVATRCEMEGIERIDVDPPSALFAGASRIISAAGFNVMLETERWRDKHDVVPFVRRFDDQFTRAARRRRAQRQSTGLS